jgi:hypothetical protein
MAAKIYSKPILFTLMVTVAVLAGSIVMMAYPMLRADMHPKLENLRPFTALQLAGQPQRGGQRLVGDVAGAVQAFAQRHFCHARLPNRPASQASIMKGPFG